MSLENKLTRLSGKTSTSRHCLPDDSHRGAEESFSAVRILIDGLEKLEDRVDVRLQ